jgi:mannosyltransferase
MFLGPHHPAVLSQPGSARGRLGRHEAVLLGVIMAGAALRFSTLGLQSFDYEETVVARIIHPGVLDTLSAALRERTPPTYYLLAWAWSQVLGTHEAGLRSLSAVIGTLTIPAAYAAGRALACRRAGLIAAALVAVNPALVWYSQYARAYVLLVLFAALGLWFFIRALREPTGEVLAGWAAMSILAMASHYFAAFLVVPEAAFLLLSSRSRGTVAAALAVVGGFGLSLVPLIVVQASAREFTEAYADRPLAGRFAGTLASFVTGPAEVLGERSPVAGLQLAGTGVAAVALVVASLLLARRAGAPERRRALVVAVVGGTALLVPVALAVAGFDYVLPRYYIGTVIALILVVAAGLGVSRAGATGLVVAAVLCIVLAAVTVADALSPSTQLPPSRDVAAAAGLAHGPRVLVVPKSLRKTLAYYLRAGHPRILRRGGHGEESPSVSSRPLSVSEIVLVSEGLDTAPSVGGFALVAHRRVQALRVYLYRSASVRRTTIAELDRRRGGSGSVLVDGPPEGRR